MPSNLFNSLSSLLPQLSNYTIHYEFYLLHPLLLNLRISIPKYRFYSVWFISKQCCPSKRENLIYRAFIGIHFRSLVCLSTKAAGKTWISSITVVGILGNYFGDYDMGSNECKMELK